MVDLPLEHAAFRMENLIMVIQNIIFLSIYHTYYFFNIMI